VWFWLRCCARSSYRNLTSAIASSVVSLNWEAGEMGFTYFTVVDLDEDVFHVGRDFPVAHPQRVSVFLWER